MIIQISRTDTLPNVTCSLITYSFGYQCKATCSGRNVDQLPNRIKARCSGGGKDTNKSHKNWRQVDTGHQFEVESAIGLVNRVPRNAPKHNHRCY